MADEPAPSVMKISGTNEAGPISVPRFNCNTFQVIGTPTEISILALSQVFGTDSDGKFEVGSVPSFQLGLSPQAAKEFVSVLQQVVSAHEEQHGKISTPFLKNNQSIQ